MSPETPIPTLDSPKLLIVDDEELDRFIFRRSILLPGIECDIKEIADPIKALAFLHEDTYTPSVLVTDIHMPEMDGYEFIAGIKKIPRLTNVPILVITSYSPDNNPKKPSLQAPPAFS
jgi:CheY-like chemotaxis protein